MNWPAAANLDRKGAQGEGRGTGRSLLPQNRLISEICSQIQWGRHPSRVCVPCARAHTHTHTLPVVDWGPLGQHGLLLHWGSPYCLDFRGTRTLAQHRVTERESEGPGSPGEGKRHTLLSRTVVMQLPTPWWTGQVGGQDLIKGQGPLKSPQQMAQLDSRLQSCTILRSQGLCRSLAPELLQTAEGTH